MKPDDQVYRWMTPCPHTVARTATMASARAVMRTYDIRHLPVLDEGALVGIVSERDLSFAERFVDPNAMTVGDVMTPDPYVVVPFEPLANVAEEMARHKYGAAIVVGKGSVIGVFSAIDALRALAEDRGYRGAIGANAS
jgi:CBS domain-containing protein